MKTPLVLRYFIWSMFIFALSMGLLSFHALHPLEYRAIEFSSSGRYYPDPETNTEKETEVPVLILPLYEQVSQDVFLRSVKDVTQRLKEAGAKVVIIPLPEYLRPSPGILSSVRELARNSAVIFGAPAGTEPYMSDRDLAPEDKQNWWVHHPLYHHGDLAWGAMTESTRDFSRLIRFVPTGIRDFDTGSPVPDVIVLALKRYFDIPDNSELPAFASRLHIGSYIFPIEHDGVTYSRLRLTNRRMVEMYVSLNLASDSLMYFPSFAKRADDTASARAAWQAHKGKIVIIDWNSTGMYRFPTRAWAYASIVNSFFTRSFVKVHNEWNVLLITTLVILLSVVSYTVRNSFMVFLSLSLAVAALAISSWLFKSHNVLFDPIYIIVPILLCGFVLPLAKLAGEKWIAEERAKSLEEENRRLLELQRSTPPETHF